MRRSPEFSYSLQACVGVTLPGVMIFPILCSIPCWSLSSMFVVLASGLFTGCCMVSALLLRWYGQSYRNTRWILLSQAWNGIYDSETFNLYLMFNRSSVMLPWGYKKFSTGRLSHIITTQPRKLCLAHSGSLTPRLNTFVSRIISQAPSTASAAALNYPNGFRKIFLKVDLRLKLAIHRLPSSIHV